MMWAVLPCLLNHSHSHAHAHAPLQNPCTASDEATYSATVAITTLVNLDRHEITEEDCKVAARWMAEKWKNEAELEESKRMAATRRASGSVTQASGRADETAATPTMVGMSMRFGADTRATSADAVHLWPGDTKVNMATGMASTGRATTAGIVAAASTTAMSATAGSGTDYLSTQPLDSREAAIGALKAYLKRVCHVTKHKRLLLKPHFEDLDHRYDPIIKC